jgi:hypothetical protein
VTRVAHTAGFLHRCLTCRSAAAVNMATNPNVSTRLDRDEHRHTIQGGGTPPQTHKINNLLTQTT